MEILIEFGKLLIPAGLVLYAMYLTVKSFLNKELDKIKFEVHGKNVNTVLPIRLQAYERICLFLERISPNNLIVRLNDAKYSAPEFQQLLLREIREEYNHNVSQQVYMSSEVWELVQNAKEDLIVTINNAAAGLSAEATSIDLARQIFEGMMQKEVDPVALALLEVKNEIRQSF
ncbi:MAG: hypothetical protein AAFX87_09430 [Bacteroidota bacterium]